jgi:hypothetical protein
VADIAHPNAAAVQVFRRSTLVSYRYRCGPAQNCQFDAPNYQSGFDDAIKRLSDKHIKERLR